ncbi:hypothetical protein K9U39_09075 [Rhodoblastus acidophilus]|uniref:Uncharacterized protein n=1 Tax=Candidatus Rhodoblastus alkanivorans TaxID=2954117 RepID=A0ABS9Z7Y2_9HYPH|nr:hypothetical protein [Candidatus Rhodoblastus alkanivorans]MCI4678996.1 hypothetical protein [Candidatus Rhodoblastus alkanivorans]MCI4683774.1 hypothetical protein [Candidatus Rhodoblastus alkanivorans]MDI4641092.1 hypothetical protein [Rhodoblastus acidophilus]
MKRKQWFDASGAASGGDFLFQSFLRLVARSRTVARPAPVRSERKPSADPAADACWTASLHRGDDLPPCRLSILAASDSPSAVRLELSRHKTGAARPDL